MKITDRLQHAWNVFIGRDPPKDLYSVGYSSSYRPDNHKMRFGNDRSIMASVYNRIAMDMAAIDIVHARLDDKDRFDHIIKGELNDRLNFSANIDQTSRALWQEACLTMLETGSVALVPVDTDISIKDDGNTFTIYSIRVGEITQWYPKHVRINVYNENTGRHEEIILPKSQTVIVQNPFYSVMNEPNSTVQRLKRKMALMDNLDNQVASGKLDLIIQLPYSIKTSMKEEQAEKRRKNLEMQLTGSKYGVGYIDGTEKIVQLNRPVENSMLNKIQYLRDEFYSQLCMTQAVMDGTADEKTMLNYYNRTIEPMVSAFVDEIRRKWLTKTARTQGQSILFFRDPFKLVPVEQLAELADKFTRNEIMASNEFRAIVGRQPSKDPRADELRNSNLNAGNDQSYPSLNESSMDSEVKSDGG